jgi:hypothetical protein
MAFGAMSVASTRPKKEDDKSSIAKRGIFIAAKIYV